jgi:hypothetical protein
MSLNSNKCGTCDFFDPIMRGTNKSVRETNHGWCAKKSIYPRKEGPGQMFPAGVARMETDEPAKPFIVRVDQVVSNCKEFVGKRVKPSKEALLKKLQEQGGKQVLK